jgi:hypothetical protein
MIKVAKLLGKHENILKNTSNAKSVKNYPSKKTKKVFLPFCAEQCRNIDLGKWLDGKIYN